MTAPGVESERVTDCTEAYVPPAGEMVGAAAAETPLALSRNSQKSPSVGTKPSCGLYPYPPISQRFPLPSVQPAASSRPPGEVWKDAIPCVPSEPYCPWSALPLIHAHSFVNGLNSQRS